MALDVPAPHRPGPASQAGHVQGHASRVPCRVAAAAHRHIPDLHPLVAGHQHRQCVRLALKFRACLELHRGADALQGVALFPQLALDHAAHRRDLHFACLSCRLRLGAVPLSPCPAAFLRVHRRQFRPLPDSYGARARPIGADRALQHGDRALCFSTPPSRPAFARCSCATS